MITWGEIAVIVFFVVSVGCLLFSNAGLRERAVKAEGALTVLTASIHRNAKDEQTMAGLLAHWRHDNEVTELKDRMHLHATHLDVLEARIDKQFHEFSALVARAVRPRKKP